MDNLDLLSAFAQAASNNALDRAFSNKASDCNPGYSTVQNVALLILGILPLATMFLGSIGSYAVSVGMSLFHLFYC